MGPGYTMLRPWNNNKGRGGGMGIKTKEGGLIVKAFFL